MRIIRLILVSMISLLLVLSSKATTYNGNGTVFNPVGLGSLNLTDDGTKLFGTINQATSRFGGYVGFNDVLVVYIDSTSGGFSDTSGFADGSDGLRRAISGFDGGVNRSTLTFAGGFSPDFALALGPVSDNFGGLYALANGGANSLGLISSANLTPLGNNNSPAYAFSINLADIGLTPEASQSFELFGTYISNSGYRSYGAVPGDLILNPGYGFAQQNSFGIYTTTPVPEPTTLALIGAGLTLLYITRYRRRFS